MCSIVPTGASTFDKKTGLPGSLGSPNTCKAVSHVRVNGLTTTRSNAVKDLDPDGLLER